MHFETVAVIDEGATLYRLDADIYKLDTPPVTSLFFVRGDGGWYVIDTGENLPASEARIVSSMTALGIDFASVVGICLTHDHWDHTDGLPHFLKHCENAAVYGAAPSNAAAGARYCRVSDGDLIGGILRVVSIGGHAPDMVGYLDVRTRSLFSGDGIQLYGIAWAGMFVFEGIGVYLDSLRRLLNMDIYCIFSSHPYVPLGAFAVGEAAVKMYISCAAECMQTLIDHTLCLYDSGVRDITLIKERFLLWGKGKYDKFPVDGFTDAIAGILKEYRSHVL